MSCQEAGEAGERYLQAAWDILVKMGIKESSVSSELLFGKPGEALTAHASSVDVTMLYIGRRDRSSISEVLLGSVCGDIIHRCRRSTIVLVC
jgi:nucleotide-binding universal stress UspA family protein